MPSSPNRFRFTWAQSHPPPPPPPPHGWTRTAPTLSLRCKEAPLGPQTLSYGCRCIACIPGTHFGERGQRSQDVWLAQALCFPGEALAAVGFGGAWPGHRRPSLWGRHALLGALGVPPALLATRRLRRGALTGIRIGFKLQALHCAETSVAPPGGLFGVPCACAVPPADARPLCVKPCVR